MVMMMATLNRYEKRLRMYPQSLNKPRHSQRNPWVGGERDQQPQRSRPQCAQNGDNAGNPMMRRTVQFLEGCPTRPLPLLPRIVLRPEQHISNGGRGSPTGRPSGPPRSQARPQPRLTAPRRRAPTRSRRSFPHPG
ncbi:unnamed protein product [Ostreobium quekettii]|uniref:Uncharacterized protein n=1 Tax=Ostreobium quekettii TaxID=121088 RepID=A0A8S1IMQ6_9CHLO|nr:unnamed protein product [Ostreobium quekettii]